MCMLPNICILEPTLLLPSFTTRAHRTILTIPRILSKEELKNTYSTALKVQVVPAIAKKCKPARSQAIMQSKTTHTATN